MGDTNPTLPLSNVKPPIFAPEMVQKSAGGKKGQAELDVLQSFSQVLQAIVSAMRQPNQEVRREVLQNFDLSCEKLIQFCNFHIARLGMEDAWKQLPARNPADGEGAVCDAAGDDWEAELRAAGVHEVAADDELAAIDDAIEALHGVRTVFSQQVESALGCSAPSIDPPVIFP